MKWPSWRRRHEAFAIPAPLAPHRQRKPVIFISRYGQLTPTPHVTVSIASKRGAHSLFCFPDNDAGNARAEMAADSLRHITGLAAYDQRPHQMHKRAPCDCCVGVPLLEKAA
jgi:hypothetical protein